MLIALENEVNHFSQVLVFVLCCSQFLLFFANLVFEGLVA